MCVCIYESIKKSALFLIAAVNCWTPTSVITVHMYRCVYVHMNACMYVRTLYTT